MLKIFQVFEGGDNWEFYIFLIFGNKNIRKKLAMLPSMRYETKKLAQLYHMKKSYKDHRNSVNKIMNKSNQSSISRSKELNYMRNRMHSAFNHTQYVRAKEIKKDNQRLYEKCSAEHHRKPQKYLLNSSRNYDPNIQKETNQFNFSESRYREVILPRREVLLKNHRNESISKMTGYDRTRENIRLAVKITQPCPTINTKKLEKIHEEAQRRKQRIMRYDSASLKSQKYLQKRFSSVSSLRSQQNSPEKQKKAQIQTENNKKWRKTYGGIANYITRSPNHPSSNKSHFFNQTVSSKMHPQSTQNRNIFRGKINQSFTFSLNQHHN